MERRNFTREFKLEAVKLVKERGVAVAQASRAKIGADGNADSSAHLTKHPRPEPDELSPLFSPGE
jgi:hypothetical protein